MRLRSISLTAQLMLTFVGLVVGTATVLTLAAYRSSKETLEGDARRTVHVEAQKLEQTLTRLIDSRRERARGFLDTVESLCGEGSVPGSKAYEPTCLKTALAELRGSERADGAQFDLGDGRIAQAGTLPLTNAAVPDAGAVLVANDRRFDYVVRVTKGRASLTLEYPIGDIVELFDDRAGLGEHGEAFLLDAAGRFVTPARYSGADAGVPRAAIGEPVRDCARRPAEVIDFDYRGVRTIHGYRPASVLFNNGCIDVHVAEAEALAPAERLWEGLAARAAIFTLAGVLVSLLASHWITAPVRRLALATHALEAGQFDRPIPIEGPSEVRALARGFAAMARSLSDLVTREQTARRQAEAANRTKDEFLAMVSHELRTPLTAILGWAWLLRSRKVRGADADQALEAIERNANTQSRLIEDLLDVSRMIVGRMQLNRTPTSLPDAVDTALEAVRPEAERKGVAIHTDLDEWLPPVFGDPPRLHQIISNLLTNALKFTPSGGRIDVTLKSEGRRLVLTIADTGVGISPDFLPHLFEAFRQADSTTTRTQTGLGLGLSIARHLALLHGGDIRAESPGAGQGSTFTLTLPAYEAAPRATSSPGKHADAAPARLDRVRVLLVDDDEESLRVVRAILEDAGASVATAASAVEARAKVTEWHPAVLVSDIAMPHENGYALVRSLREANALVPAIALTAYGRREDEAEAQAAGFQMFIAKPVQRQDLVDGIAALAKSGS
jgi:signal transduction histidine kinase/ActR/RegA family two-component response regulator